MAIKASDLRIGNLFKNKIIDKIEVVNSIHKGLVNACHYSPGDLKDVVECEEGEMDPIPLAEEWLLRFGFEKKGARYSLDTSYLDTYSNGIFDFGLGGIGNILQITFVHQLQNLYHSFTGEELLIKEV